jgi:Xaa-Pro aminopeptidase
MSIQLNKLRKELAEKEMMPFLISDLFNIKYLTGFSGTNAYMIISKDKTYFVTDGRYQEHAKKILKKNITFLLQEGEIHELIKTLCKELEIKEIFIEDHSIKLSSFNQLKKKLRGVKLKAAGSPVNIQRMVKEKAELDIIREAARITDACFDHLCSFISPGMTEWEVSLEIERFYKSKGCKKNSFDSIVASGIGSSMPHYETSMEKKIEKGDVLLIDMGCHYQGYNSDLTRTLFINSVDPRIEEFYYIVDEARSCAVKAVKPGLYTGEIDEIARSYITDEGFGEYFSHSLGHGYGLEVHELPAVNKDGDVVLKKNMTITIEPGIYIPNIGGVRIEDMILVCSKGAEVLTNASRDIIVL